MNSLFIRIASFKEMIRCVTVSGRGSEKLNAWKMKHLDFCIQTI